MGKASRIGLLWDSVSDNMGDQAIGLVLRRALSAYGLPTEIVDPFTANPHDLAMLVIGGGELIRTPGDPFYDAFRVPGNHVLNPVGVLDGSATSYLADYRIVTTRSQSSKSKLARGEVYPCLSLVYGDYVPSIPMAVDIPKSALGIHAMPRNSEESLALIHYLRKADIGPIVWLPVTHYANDEALMREMAKHVPGSVLLPKLPPDDIYKVIGSLRMLVTASLHAAIFAYAQDVPFISIERYPKVGYFLRERQLDEHLVQTMSDLQTLLPRWIHRPANTNHLRSLDQTRCRELLERIRAHADDALCHTDTPSVINLPPTNRSLYEEQMKIVKAEGERIADDVAQRIYLQSRNEAIQDIQPSVGDSGLPKPDVEHDISAAPLVRTPVRRITEIFRKQQLASSLEASAQLVFSVETDLTEPVIVGKGIVLPLQGWCYSQRGLIRKLEVLINGKPRRVAAHSRARMDVFNNQCPAFDQSGNSLLSGFHTILPFTAIQSPERVQLGLRAFLDDGSAVEQAIGSLELHPVPDAQPVPVKWHAGTGRVAICMTASNPSPDIFIKQIESIQKQTYPNWVCIISDDASSPVSRSTIRDAIKGDDRFTLIENETRLGFYRNFERALRFTPADADFIALSDHDDLWFPDKIEALLAEFQEDTQLVYSDMKLIDPADQVVAETFWTSRKNNYRNLATLFFANTITGAASMFRAALLPILLPFPERVIDAYHDHWLGLTALVKGKIRFINRPLYGYRQHGSNVIGHRIEQRYPGLLHSLKAIARSGCDRMKLQALGREILGEAVQAYPHIIHKIVLAKTLLLRQPDARPSKKRILRRIARFERSLLPPITEYFRAAISRRPSLGREWFHVRTAFGVRVWDFYFRNQRYRLLHTQLQRAQAAASFGLSSSIATPKSRSGLPMMQAMRYGQTEWIAHNFSPLRLDISDANPRRVNMLMATIDFRYVYGGYIGMFSLALSLKRAGYRIRIILTEKTEYDLEKWRFQAQRYPGFADLFDEMEILYRYDRELPVKVNPRDTFIATSCWTAHIAHVAVRELKQERFTFLVQDYEPVFVPMNSVHAIFMQAYTFPQYNLFSTELLQEYFRIHRIGIYGSSENDGEALSVSFQNAINRFSVTPGALKHDRKKLLFYARPEPHAARNLYELGVMSLMELLHDRKFDISRWTFHGIGSIDLKTQVALAPNVPINLVPRTGLQEYLDLLPTFDVGLSLMLTPHPSLVPLEMAAAGLWTVTNTFANKTADKLRAISSNLIAVPPTISGIKEGLLQAIRQVDDYDQRIAGTNIHWASDWQESFNPQVMEKLKSFLG
jgi:glycosyltransferase involved in cell wall biosynthesis